MAAKTKRKAGGKSKSAKGKPKKWMQKAAASMKRRGTVGSFTAWCKSQGYGGVTSECIAAGKRSKSGAIRKKANFAANARKAR
jgi:hypothetical protein